MTPVRSLTPDEAQQSFRAFLDALAHPGRIVPLDTAALPAGRYSALLPMLALTDLMTPIATLDEQDDQLRELAIVTGAPVVPLGEARWVLGTSGSVSRFRELSSGVALHPERGAVVCLQVDLLGTGPAYELRGPGIDGCTRLQVTGLPDGFAQARGELIDTPPCGVDFLLVAPHAVAAIPRTTTLSTVPLTESAEAIA